MIETSMSVDCGWAWDVCQTALAIAASSATNHSAMMVSGIHVLTLLSTPVMGSIQPSIVNVAGTVGGPDGDGESVAAVGAPATDCDGACVGADVGSVLCPTAGGPVGA
jgi:hypothetical protein